MSAKAIDFPKEIQAFHDFGSKNVSEFSQHLLFSIGFTTKMKIRLAKLEVKIPNDLPLLGLLPLIILLYKLLTTIKPNDTIKNSLRGS